MFRTIALTSILALGAAGIAQAQDSGPQMIGGGDDIVILYGTPSRNVVGGGSATLSGGGLAHVLTYGSTKAQPQSGMIAQLIGGGDEQALVYRPMTVSTVTLAGQANSRGG